VGPRITLDILMHREIIAITNVAILHWLHYSILSTSLIL
jgi:hypothetical protein